MFHSSKFFFLQAVHTTVPGTVSITDTDVISR